MGGPCTPWVTLGETQADPTAVNPNGTPLDDVLLAEMIDVASEVLWALSAEQFSGECSDSVRPLRRYYDASSYMFGNQLAWRYQWGAHWCGRPPERAGGCGALTEITLGAYPIRDILAVRIDSVLLDPSWYRVDDHRWLVHVDQSGASSFPCCQNLRADPMTDLDTFEVDFTWGQAPPVMGVVAARKLAIELTKAASGNPCNLPDRVLNVAVQGMTYTMLDPLLFLDKGRTGIYFVDLFLNAVNPNFLKRAPQVISPDIGRPVRRTSTSPGS